MLELYSDIFTDARMANVIAWGSLLAALISLRYTRLAHERNKPLLRFETWCVFDDDYPGHVEIKATNVGRLPLSMLKLRGEDEKGRVNVQFFSSHLDAGLKLGEHDVHIFKVSHLPRGPASFNADAMDAEDDVQFEFCRLWIEDALGECIEIPGMKAQLPALAAHYKAWCTRTGYWRASINNSESIQAKV